MDLADANQTWEYTSNEGETLTLAANMQGEVEGEGFLLADGWWIAVNYEGTIRRTSPYTFQVKVLDQHAETAPGDEGGVTWAPQLDATFNCDYTWHDDTMTPSLDCFSTSSDQAFVFEGAAG